MDREKSKECETTEVIICGGGPTGALLSALLGKMKVPNIVLELEKQITTDPRGIALDEEGIRNLQSIGMYDRVYTQIAQCQNMQFISGTESNLMKTPFLRFDMKSSCGGTGHVGAIFHKQPELERAIRDAISQTPHSEMRLGCQLSSIIEDESDVRVAYTDPHGSTQQVRARFLVGADGKTGFVRKRYLEPRGISMDVCEGKKYDEVWIAINWVMRLPTPESHPDFPLWKLGYTPEQVYDLFFPPDFRFLCLPKRAAVCGRFGPVAERLWRFEFVVQPGEDPEQMATEQGTSRVVVPYITHPGQRYNLDHPVRYPEDCITVLRSRPYHFSARSCNKWALRRVIVAGDAAHVFPPFGGQGIASGFRDAAALAWRLAHLHREPTADYNQLLRSWYTERKQQLEQSLIATIRNGEFVTNGSLLKSFFRDWSLWLLQFSPSIKHYFEKGPRAGGMIRYQQESGLPFIAKFGGGLNIPQVYAKDLLKGELIFTDDLIFKSSDHGLLQLLILADTVEQARESWEEAQGLSVRTEGRLREDEATILLHDLTIDRIDRKIPMTKIARIASGAEFAAHPDLCRGRPAPRDYDPSRIRKEVGSAAVFVVLRPDRYVYAACSNIEELHSSLETLNDSLCISRG